MKRQRSDSSDSSSERYVRKAKHREGYNPEWKNQYPWLLPVSDDDDPRDICGLFCELCQRYKVTQRSGAGTWVSTPCTILRKDVIERHNKSNMHKEALDREATRLSVVRHGGIQQAFERQVCAQKKALIGALKIVYTLAKQEIPLTTKYEPVLELAISLGCDYLKELEVGANARYRSHAIIGEFLQVLATVVEEQQFSLLRSSKFFSLLTDESTDISVKKQLVLVARYLSGKQVKTAFVEISDIPDGTANTITQAIHSFMAKRSLDINHLRGFATDGASVMVGRHSGVATQLKRSCPSLISIHCVNHRLALAASHAADHIPYLQRFKTHLRNLFYFYQNSSVRTSGLHAIQALLDDPFIKLKEAKDVRWLSHDAAIATVLRILPSLIASLEREATERGEPMAEGLVRFVKSYNFIATAHLLHKVFPHISRLCRIFQKEDVDFTMLSPCVNATIAGVNSYKDDPLSEIESTLSTDLKDYSIRTTETQKTEFQKKIQEKYITNLVSQLKDRLPEVKELEAFSIFDPSKLPEESAEENFTAYGKDKIEHLSSRYGEGDKADICKMGLSSEWITLKPLLSQSYREVKCKDFLILLSSDSTLMAMFPNFAVLASIALVVPVSTAECERCFSSMKRIKTVLRNRMDTKTLDQLIRISNEGPNPEHFDFNIAADLWGSRRQRRITV